ncbi:MAG: Uma2 family endonuclease, partial [Spirochaetales bacterium]|nr:Uma2 family endonuclease [Spirochaetales bacterium]
MLTQIKAFLHSENGNTTPELDTILVAYDFTRDLPDSIHKCIVWGHLKDYLSWPDEKRFELIHGIAYAMSPAPSRRHQKISMYISSMFFNYLE